MGLAKAEELQIQREALEEVLSSVILAAVTLCTVIPLALASKEMALPTAVVPLDWMTTSEEVSGLVGKA